ncbi:hypothetical protein FRC17_005246 [Serendipita sp. 399]|nr:hypothetical protein FRC17_005246 [Serendipita sp. 399]
MKDDKICTWGGVSCDDSGSVIGLTLQFPALPQTIPNELSVMTSLSTLSIAGDKNHPTGQLGTNLPSSIRDLRLYNTSLQGFTSDAIFRSGGALAGLTALTMDGNWAMGSRIPGPILDLPMQTITVRNQNLDVDLEAIGTSAALANSLVTLTISHNSYLMKTTKADEFSKEFPPGTGDVQLVSSDGVTFHFHQFLLSHNSPVFRDMFVVGNGPPRIAVTEDSTTLNLLLRFFGSTKEFEFLPAKDAIPLLEAARKYQVPHVIRWWERETKRWGKDQSKEAMDCLALALRHGLHEVADIAFEYLVGAPESELQSRIPIADNQILNQLIRRRTQRKKQVFELLKHMVTLTQGLYDESEALDLAKCMVEIGRDLNETPRVETLLRHQMPPWIFDPGFRLGVDDDFQFELAVQPGWDMQFNLRQYLERGSDSL